MPETKSNRREDADELAFLGREFMTWLLWRVDQGEETFGAGEQAFTLGFGSRVRLDALAGDVTAAVLRGGPAAHSVMARAGIGAGSMLREAELRAVRGEKEWRFTLDADSFDLKGVKLPELLTEEDDDRFLERIALTLELDALVKAAFAEFARERARPSWRRAVVPAIREWVVDGLKVRDRVDSR